LRALRRDLAPFPGRFEFALRLAIVCALATWVVEIYQTPSAALTAYVAFFLVRSERVASIAISLAANVILTATLAALIVIADVVIDMPWWRVATMAAISFAMMFVASASKLRLIAPIVALVAAYALDLLARAQIGEFATRSLLYAWLLFGVPGAVTIVVSLLAAPSPRTLAERALAERLAAAARVLRRSDEVTRRAFAEALGTGISDVREWLRFAGIERTSASVDLAALHGAGESMTNLLLLVDEIVRDDALPPPYRERLADTFDEMAEIFRTGGYPVDIELQDSVHDAVLSPEAARRWAEARNSLAEFTATVEAAEAHEGAGAHEATERSGLFVADAFTDPMHVRFALKTTAAALVCYATYTLLDWPGIHTALITCYIVALATAAETVEKLTLRVAGCLVGAALGTAAIVYVMPAVTSIGGLLGVVLVAALASAWVAVGSPRIAYAGFQMAFALFLCVIQGPSPEFDLTVARDRVVGILFGNLMMYLMFTLVWPVSIGPQIDRGLGAAFDALRRAVQADRVQRRTLLTDAHIGLRAAETNLALAHYEPRSVRPSSEWLAARGRLIDEAAVLERRVPLASAADAGGSIANESIKARIAELERALTPDEPTPAVAHAAT
jgi:multidrug resistance protein MdtO